MLKIKNLTIKNFLSVGNVSQAVSFAGEDLVLVLGENLDLGGGGSKNGVGKSTIANALSYVLYGESLVKIKRDNLINKINAKNMLVTIDFEVGTDKYRIERGRKPNVLRFIANGKVHVDGETDEAQGDSRLTQVEIERILGISSDMFKHIVALNTYTEPFLSMRSNDQRAIIEQLLGITKLSEKAMTLKEQIKETKDKIKEQELKHSAISVANKRIEENIARYERSAKVWDKAKQDEIQSYKQALENLLELDVDMELAAHRDKDLEQKLDVERKSIKQKLTSVNKEKKIYENNLATLTKNISLTVETSTCHACGQDLDCDTHEKVRSELQQQIDDTNQSIHEKEIRQLELQSELKSLGEPVVYETFYTTVEDVFYHKNSIEQLTVNLERSLNDVNPYVEQINDLRESGLQRIDYTEINELSLLCDHQEFLLKLLTNKDSFIRKKIIDQNLSFLNHQLGEYLVKLGLPHKVKFKPDLEVEITELGRDYDFDNLSRGERTRLILSLSWAFRDVYESLTNKLNLLFIDELLDSGLDSTGVESALSVLKKMVREQKRNVFLISHRDELVGRVNSVLKVVKENSFTSFDMTDTNLL